jgi:hypothetical protein
MMTDLSVTPCACEGKESGSTRWCISSSFDYLTVIQELAPNLDGTPCEHLYATDVQDRDQSRRRLSCITTPLHLPCPHLRAETIGTHKFFNYTTGHFDDIDPINVNLLMSLPIIPVSSGAPGDISPDRLRELGIKVEPVKSLTVAPQVTTPIVPDDDEVAEEPFSMFF